MVYCILLNVDGDWRDRTPDSSVENFPDIAGEVLSEDTSEGIIEAEGVPVNICDFHL